MDGFGYQKEIESACIFVYCKNAVLVMNAYGSMLPAALDVVNPCNISLAYRYTLGLNLSSNSNILFSAYNILLKRIFCKILILFLDSLFESISER